MQDILIDYHNEQATRLNELRTEVEHDINYQDITNKITNTALTHGTIIKGIYMVAEPNYLSLSGHDLILKKKFGISPEKHYLTAMPYRLFQGKLQN